MRPASSALADAEAVKQDVAPAGVAIEVAGRVQRTVPGLLEHALELRVKRPLRGRRNEDVEGLFLQGLGQFEHGLAEKMVTHRAPDHRIDIGQAGSHGEPRRLHAALPPARNGVREWAKVSPVRSAHGDGADDAAVVHELQHFRLGGERQAGTVLDATEMPAAQQPGNRRIETERHTPAMDQRAYRCTEAHASQECPWQRDGPADAPALRAS